MWRRLIELSLLFGMVLAARAEEPTGFYAEYPKVSDADFREWRQSFREDRVLEELADSLNGVIELPTRVALRFEECGEANAFYDPEQQRVSLCYELAEDVMNVFEDRTEEEIGDLAAGTMLFFLGHEVGHALTHVLELPITGREEDAVDQLAVLLLSDGSEESEAALIATAETFAAWSEAAEVDESVFADEHSLDLQRLYNILCWSYGRDPEAYADLVDEDLLPEARAERCGEEFEQLDRAWGTLLEDYLVE
jgi:predicted house-cleaning noncanonical NTP pyrophosphatase (MazG superfamily)